MTLGCTSTDDRTIEAPSQDDHIGNTLTHFLRMGGDGLAQLLERVRVSVRGKQRTRPNMCLRTTLAMVNAGESSGQMQMVQWWCNAAVRGLRCGEPP